MNEKDHRLDDLFKEYHTLVIRNAYLFVKDYHTAEDICQETFIRLGENLEKVRPEKVKPWLIRVSERLALDYLKKGGKHAVTPGLEACGEEFADEHYFDLSSMMVQREEVEYRERALDRLKMEKPEWYEILVMSCLEDMDNRTIGEELGVKPNLVSKRKERARRRLRDIYRDDYEEKGS